MGPSKGKLKRKELFQLKTTRGMFSLPWRTLTTWDVIDVPHWCVREAEGNCQDTRGGDAALEAARKGLSEAGSPLQSGIQCCWSTSGCCTKMDCWVSHSTSLVMEKLRAGREVCTSFICGRVLSRAVLCCPAGSWSSATPCCFPWRCSSFQTGMLGICHLAERCSGLLSTLQAKITLVGSPLAKRWMRSSDGQLANFI